MEKKLKAESFNNARALVWFVNDNNITKEDILTVYPNKGEIFLIYYGRE